MRLNDMLLSFPSIFAGFDCHQPDGAGQIQYYSGSGGFFLFPVLHVLCAVKSYAAVSLILSRVPKLWGAGDFRIIFLHILPNAGVSILTAAAIGFNNAVLAEAKHELSRPRYPAAGTESWPKCCRRPSLISSMLPGTRFFRGSQLF